MSYPRRLSARVNGPVEFGPSPTNEYSYAVDGTFGGGTVEVGYMSNGSFVKYTDVTALTASGQGVITCGQLRNVAFNVLGATAPNIEIQVNLIH